MLSVEGVRRDYSRYLADATSRKADRMTMVGSRTPEIEDDVTGARDMWGAEGVTAPQQTRLSRIENLHQARSR